jgi:hypothetical protein
MICEIVALILAIVATFGAKWIAVISVVAWLAGIGEFFLVVHNVHKSAGVAIAYDLTVGILLSAAMWLDIDALESWYTASHSSANMATLFWLKDLFACKAEALLHC